MPLSHIYWFYRERELPPPASAMTTFSIDDEELDVNGIADARWHLERLEGIEDHPSEGVMLMKEALRDFIREQEEAV